MQAFVPKTRRPVFELQLNIFDLNNVPLVTGTSYVKWNLPSSTSAEHRGRTSKAMIREHKVIWDYVKTIPVRLTIDKNGMLQDSDIEFEVLQEYSPSAKTERIPLGTIKLNLAEYVEGSDDGEEDIVRRYLMQESKINSTLKVGIRMRQIEGEHNFIAPPLKTAPVFGGIAGIVTGEQQREGNETSNMPSISSKAQESGKLQDMYRQNLAATWAAQAGELPPDKCVEDIFAGGDGWGDQGAGTSSGSDQERNGAEENGQGMRTPTRHRRNLSGGTIKPRPNHIKRRSSPDAVSGRATTHQRVQRDSDARGHRTIRSNELDEIAERDDLRSWRIPVPN